MTQFLAGKTLRSGALLFALSLALLAAAGVDAAPVRTFQCNKIYTNTSKANDITKCLGDPNHMQAVALSDDHLPHIVFAILPLVVFIITFLCCPVVCCSRYVCGCCCGGGQRRPDGCCRGSDEWLEKSEEEVNAGYPRSSVRNTKACAVFVFALGLGMMLCAIVGTTMMNSTYVKVFEETKGVLSWVDKQALNIKTVLTINETGELIPPLNQGFFTNISNTIEGFRKDIDNLKKTGDPYMEYITIGGFVIGIVPLVFLIFTVLAAVLDGRGCCWIKGNVCCHCIFMIPYTILSFVLLIIAWALGTVCGERDTYIANPKAPALVSLCLRGVCQENLPFETTKSDVRALIKEQAQKACTAMLDICDPFDAYDPINGRSKVYNCQNLRNATTDCVTFQGANAVANSFTLKPNPLVYCRTNQNDAGTQFSPCNISMCAKYCNVDTARQISGNITVNLGYAANGEVAFTSYVEPLLDCDVIYDQALRPLVVCPTLTSALQLLGGSFFGYGFLFMVGMVVLWRGEKRFFKPNKDEDADDGNSDLEMSKKGDFDDLASQSKTDGFESNEPKA